MAEGEHEDHDTALAPTAARAALDGRQAATLFDEIAGSLRRGRAVALATVVQTERSVPRHAGAKMLVHADGTTVGTIGGGEMEARVIAAGLDALDTGVPALHRFDLVDPADGDPGVCGGTVEVYVEPLQPEPTMLIVGAGHVGVAVHQLASWLAMPSVLWDDRDQPPELAAGLDVRGGDLADVLDTLHLDQRGAVVLVSRNMGVDLAALPAVLASNAGYIGLMGSNRRWQTTRASLVESGHDETTLDRIHAPIGLEIEAETPEEIAVSILAEVISHRRGG